MSKKRASKGEKEGSTRLRAALVPNEDPELFEALLALADEIEQVDNADGDPTELIARFNAAAQAPPHRQANIWTFRPHAQRMSREAIVASFVAGSPGTLTKITFDELVEVARRWLDAVAERDYAKITFYSDVLKQNTPHSRVEDLVFERGPEKGIRMALEG